MKIKLPTFKLTCISTGLLSALSAGHAFAQQQEHNTELEVIEISAERRTASVQDTAITMDVLSGNTLQERGVVNLEGITNLVPALNFNKDTIYTSFTLRGVGSSNANNLLGDNSITVAIDGEYINRPVAINTAMFDLERVEVLRGPQGTLYGKNATAGAINLIAARPELDFNGGEVMAEIGAFNNKLLQGSANFSVSDNVAVRAAVNVNRRDGYRDAGDAGDVDDASSDAVRLGLLYTPSADTSVYMAAEYSKVDQTAPSRYGVSLQGEYTAGLAPSDFTTEIPDEWEQGDAGHLKIDQYALRTEITHEFDTLALNYLASYRNVDVDSYQPLNGFVPSLFNFMNMNEITTVNHELRLLGEQPKYFWQAGVFYGTEEQKSESGAVVIPADSAWLNYFDHAVDTTTAAVFAQGTVHLTEKLDLTVGGRYTKDKKSRDAYDLAAPSFALGIEGYPTKPNAEAFVETSGPTSASWGEVTWQLGLDYHLNKQSMFFAKASKGYKAGGFDAVGDYEPEILLAFEAGIKSDLLNNKLRLNLSTFHYDYKNQQVAVLRDISIGYQTLNAGETSINGIELTSNYMLSDNDQVDVSINYLDASFDTFPTTQALVLADASTYSSDEDYLAVSTVNLKGNTPPQSPEWSVAVGYKHYWTMENGDIVFALNSQLKSSYYLTPFNWESDKQNGYSKTSLRLTYQSYDNWKLTAYVNNVEDEQDLTYSAFTGGPSVSIYNFAKNVPRTWGIQYNYTW